MRSQLHNACHAGVYVACGDRLPRVVVPAGECGDDPDHVKEVYGRDRGLRSLAARPSASNQDYPKEMAATNGVNGHTNGVNGHSGSALCSIEEFTAQKYDYIVVGGGTAGCVVAARLTEDPNITVGVIEAGANRMDDVNVLTPSLYPTLVCSFTRCRKRC